MKKASSNTAREFFRELAKDYEAIVEHYEWVAPERLLKNLSRYYNICSSEKKILDVGVGTGLFANALHNVSSDNTIIGVDISPEMLVECKDKGIIEDGYLLDITESTLPFPDNHFDVVGSCGMFEYIENPDNPLEEMVRVLKTNGILALTTQETEGVTASGDELNVCKMPDALDLLKQFNLKILGSQVDIAYSLADGGEREVKYNYLVAQKI